jgi:transposase
MNILAMDLGKSKTVVCFYDSKTGKHKYGKIRTTPQQMHDLLAEHMPDRVVFEICSSAGWLYDICSCLKLDTEVANPNTQGWRWKNVRNKNDRSDALKLAQLSSMNQLPVVHMPRRSVRQKRSIIQYRQSLVRQRTRIKNSIRAILNRQGQSMPNGMRGWSMASIKRLKGISLPLEQCGIDNLWRGQLGVELEMLEKVASCIAKLEQKLDSLGKEDNDIQLLQTICGVGPRLAEAVAAFIDEPDRFETGKQVGSYVGLTPRQYQSGDMDHQGKISGAGNKVLRSLLVEVSWLGLRHNKWMNETYHRILRGSESRKKIAITALARKLLVRCWAMLRDGQPWSEGEIEADREAA